MLFSTGIPWGKHDRYVERESGRLDYTPHTATTEPHTRGLPHLFIYPFSYLLKRHRFYTRCFLSYF